MFGNACSLIHVAQSDRKDADALVGIQLLGDVDRVALLVFAVGKDHDRFVVIGFADESVGGRRDRVAQSRTTTANRVRTDGIERLFEVFVVAGQRNRLSCVAGKRDQPDAVARHFVDHVLDLLLGPTSIDSAKRLRPACCVKRPART